MCDDCFQYCDKSFKMAVEHRYSHEYGEMSNIHIPNAPSTPKTSAHTGRSVRGSVGKSIDSVGASLKEAESVRHSTETKQQRDGVGGGGVSDSAHVGIAQRNRSVDPAAGVQTLVRSLQDRASLSHHSGEQQELSSGTNNNALTSVSSSTVTGGASPAFTHYPAPPSSHPPPMMGGGAQNVRKERTPRRDKEKASSPELSAKEKFEMSLTGDVNATAPFSAGQKTAEESLNGGVTSFPAARHGVGNIDGGAFHTSGAAGATERRASQPQHMLQVNYSD